MATVTEKAVLGLRKALLDAAGRAVADGVFSNAALPAFTIEIPADTAHGDYATNMAMASARALRMAPRKIAQAICDRLDLSETVFDRWEIAGPGFMNFFLGDRYYAAVMQEIAQQAEKYGRSDFGGGKRVLVEFVSANPTGPMHMGNARGGALGDCLAAVLDAAGFDVEREFYVNDAGNQIEKFGLSLSIRYQQLFLGEEAVPLPETCYQGGDIIDHAQAYKDEFGDKLMHTDDETRRRELVAYALPKNIAKMKSDIAKYRIDYDTWFMESTLHESGQVMETVQMLTDKGLTYEKEGAIWYKSTAFGAEKDDVLVRANGNPTYFAADIAYHRNKFAVRGFDECIDVWGADHHGHVARMKGAMNAVGLDGDKLTVVLMQLVNLLKDGKPVKISKRTGKAIQLADLLDEVPVDAARFLFNMRESNTQMDFDLDLAVKQDNQNPVYYVQYANARICSILRALEKEQIVPRDCTAEELMLLKAPEERELIRHLAAYPTEIVTSAKEYDPARITRYVITLANLFHKFYNACRVKGEDESLMQARLQVCLAVRTVIRNVLAMFKVSAPDQM
ncbi:MAG: arginine--tRNA ligase [Clostridia bacterium]|nr:arginine--tRNA ligase [Clostridia bacterium]